MNSFSDSARAALDLLFAFDPALLAIVARSLAVSLCACALACAIGLPLGGWLGVRLFAGRGAVLALLNTLLALPSVVVGLVVYLLLSRSGPLGFLGWLFSFKAMVLAQTILVVPVVAALSRQLVEDAERAHGEQLASLGARPLVRAALLMWDMRLALLTVVITAFGRAVSEVGAVMIVGGNIDGFTRVMTTAIALETSKGDLPLALALGLVLLAVVLALNALVAGLRRLGSSIMSVVQISGVDLRFGAVQALRGCTLSIARGERVGVIGANGSGKSSLLRLLHGLLQPQAGTVLRQAGLRQAFVFQRPWMLHASAQANVALGLWLAGVAWPNAKARALAALERVGLDAQRDQNAKTLSGGQQQRLALARAWALNPEVLLLDEPTANLDPATKKDVESLMAQFADSGCTLVFSSHNLGQVKRLASRVVYIEHGVLVADLPVHAFFNGPLPHAAENFVKGELG